MIFFALMIAAIVLVVVPPVVWWAVTRVVPRVMNELGIDPRTGGPSPQEARLQRIEEAIDALALQVDRLSRARELPAPERAALPPGPPAP